MTTSHLDLKNIIIVRRLSILIVTVLASLSSFSQDSLSAKWIFTINFGIQEHDKRLFDYPQQEYLLKLHPEFFGTYQFGANLVKQVILKNNFGVFVGGGLSSELSTFTRPYNHNYGDDVATLDLRVTDRYYQNLFQLTFRPQYWISKSLSLSLEILPQFVFLTIADNTKSNNTSTWWRFDFYSVEFNPGIEYTTSKYYFGLKYRVFQIKKIDKILFNSIIGDPRTDQTLETENPVKFWFSIGFKF